MGGTLVQASIQARSSLGDEHKCILYPLMLTLELAHMTRIAIKQHIYTQLGNESLTGVPICVRTLPCIYDFTSTDSLSLLIALLDFSIFYG